MTIEERVRDTLEYYEDLQGRCSVFSSEFTVYKVVIQVLKELLNE